EEEKGRGDQASPQVVEDLPASEKRETVARETSARRDHREEPEEDLPVAAHPAMQAPRVREDVPRIVVDDLHVGDERGAGEEAFEEVVRKEPVLRHAPF